MKETWFLASPYFGKETLRGLFFFIVESMAEAKKRTRSGHPIQDGILKIEMKEWCGAAALPLLLELQI